MTVAAAPAQDLPRKERMLRARLQFLIEALGAERPMRILDVGANPVNTPDYQILLEMQGCRVWGFEPDKAAFEALQDKPNAAATYMNAAVGPTGKATFYHHPQNALGSTFPIRPQSVEFLGRPGWHKPDGQTSDITLQALDDMPDLPKPDVLKIDIQGGELGVLQTGQDTLSDAVAIIPEVRFYRLYEGEPMFGEVDTALHRMGFVLHKFLFSKTVGIANSQAGRAKPDVMRNQLMDGDAVYIRNLEDPTALTPLQLKQLALAAAGIFDSLDLTLHCLDRLVERDAVAQDLPAAYVDQLPKWMTAAEGQPA